MRYLSPLAFAALAIAPLAACSSSPAGSGSPCTDDSGCEPSLVCVDGVCVADVEPDSGDDAADLGSGTDAADDTATADSTDDAEADSGDSGLDAPDAEVDGGVFGDPCGTDDDCLTGYCLDLGDTEVCTVPCTDTCPDPEWECRLLTGSGGDLLELCVPPAETLCEPCTRNIDCGSADALCLDLIDGQFCGSACSTNADCPADFTCTTATGGDVTAQQCVPVLGICGDCLDVDGDLHGQGAGCLAADCDDEDPTRYAGAAEICDQRDNDCDDVTDEGFDLTSDLVHCGACGNVCEVVNATPACVDSACAVGTCLEPYDDCNGSVDDGCETDLTTSVEHCGRCGEACVAANGTSFCSESTCAVASCNFGFDDCNGAPGDGCEVSLLDDVANCGVCGNACGTVSNASAACLAGACRVAFCGDGYLDCNGVFEDGCEASQYATNTCLTCDTVCAFDNAEPGCGATGCFLAACLAGFVDADRRAENGCEYVCTPTGAEICDGTDNDCDGRIDNDVAGAPTWYRDADGDTYGTVETQVVTCDAPFGFVASSTDCNDLNPAVNPGATEVCNGLDDNCAGGIDNGLSFDVDGDLHYSVGSCALPNDDCDDGNPLRFGGNLETCDGYDNDCNGSVDPINSPGCQVFYTDSDDDGFGVSPFACACAASGSLDAQIPGDCYDGNSSARPGQTAWYSSARGDGSYDYNCDTVESRRWTSTAGTCELFGDLCDGGSDGWTSGVPVCGANGTWAQGCEFYTQIWPPEVGCRRSSSSSRRQECQ